MRAAFRSAQRSVRTETKRKWGFRIPSAHVNENVVARKSETRKAETRTTIAPAEFNDVSIASAKSVPNNPPAGRGPRTSGNDSATAEDAGNLNAIRVNPVKRKPKWETEPK